MPRLTRTQHPCVRVARENFRIGLVERYRLAALNVSNGVRLPRVAEPTALGLEFSVKPRQRLPKSHCFADRLAGQRLARWAIHHRSSNVVRRNDRVLRRRRRMHHERQIESLMIDWPAPVAYVNVGRLRQRRQQLVGRLCRENRRAVPRRLKTTTVVKLLALLQSQALASKDKEGDEPRALRIRLAAPTGKAAARLNESIAGAVARLPLDAFAHGDAIRAAIPTIVTTLHRLLGTVPNSRRFRHHAGNPLSLDVLVIDEASMIDLEMMHAVLAALPPGARIVLLGDKDQLASVEAGAVLGELCRRASGAHYTPATQARFEAESGERIDAKFVDASGSALDQSIAMLRESYRFSSESGIGQLAEAVNSGDKNKIDAVWMRALGDIAFVACPERGDAVLKALVVEGKSAIDSPGRYGYRHYLEVLRDARPSHRAEPAAFDAWAHDVLHAHGQFQVLCALRRGPWGVEGMNRRIARMLQEENLIHANAEWYAGRPVLVTHNDYELGLMNGDIGITLALPVADGKWSLRVAFAAGDGTTRIRWVLPSRLQAVETVFALTVHKSQGSEFTHAALVLPDRISSVLTRELVYTGITRARSFLTIASAGGKAIVERAAQARVVRASGLSAAFDAT
jgi:exodeoxyribonuclease V alpha subunit